MKRLSFSSSGFLVKILAYIRTAIVLTNVESLCDDQWFSLPLFPARGLWAFLLILEFLPAN